MSQTDEVRPRQYIREVSPVMALESLRSTLCPACGLGKAPRRSLCIPCFVALPARIKERLYLKLGKGYEPALRDALNELHCSGIHMEHPQLTRAAEAEAGPTGLGEQDDPAARPLPHCRCKMPEIGEHDK